MTPVMRARLLAASEFVLAELGKKTSAADIISGLDNHRAHYRRGDPNILRVAGVAVSCTSSADVGLLGYWRKAAMSRIMAEKADG